MLSLLARSWWALALRGVAAVVFGLLAVIIPGFTLVALIYAFAIYAIVDGAGSLVLAIRGVAHNERWAALMTHGLIGVAAGVAAFFFPALAALAFVYLVAAWALFAGLLTVIGAWQLRSEVKNEWLFMIAGALQMLAGFVFLFLPSAASVAIVWTLGLYAILYGVVLVALGLRLRSLGARLEPAHP